MKVKVLKEAGYEEALYGISLSYRNDDEPLDVRISRMREIAPELASKEDGHNKFLESMMVWVEIDAPRNWWQQADTYRIGVTKQSESTMHTMLKRPLTQDDFDAKLHPFFIEHLNVLIANKDWEAVKDHLPESFLQRRIVCLNYKTIRHILKQRHHHRLKQWVYFCKEIYKQLMYVEFLPDIDLGGK